MSLVTIQEMNIIMFLINIMYEGEFLFFDTITDYSKTRME